MDQEADDFCFRARVRYAECNAHGDLPLATYVTYFCEAAAWALRRVGFDLTAQLARDGILRESGVVVDVLASPSYDDEVVVTVELESLQDDAFVLACMLRRRYGNGLLANGRLSYAHRRSTVGHIESAVTESLQSLKRLSVHRTAVSS